VGLLCEGGAATRTKQRIEHLHKAAEHLAHLEALLAEERAHRYIAVNALRTIAGWATPTVSLSLTRFKWIRERAIDTLRLIGKEVQ